MTLSHCVGYVGLELVVFLPLPPECLDYRGLPPRLVFFLQCGKQLALPTRAVSVPSRWAATHWALCPVDECARLSFLSWVASFQGVVLSFCVPPASAHLAGTWLALRKMLRAGQAIVFSLSSVASGPLLLPIFPFSSFS